MNDVDFDALARKANQSGGAREDLNKLFGAVFALDEWIFIARGELPNISPYIAARADYQNGQQMIRAFTDSARLLRFAKENNLTNPDGGAEMLGTPTKGVVEYLEQFIGNGVDGVWFNSDAESDGFSIPLKQLRPIKEHLAKLPSADESKPFAETIIVVVKDGLMLPSGFVKQATYDCVFYCRVPTDWTENGDLKAAHLEKIYEKVYGATWRAGNGDGSRYVVEKSYSNVIKPEALKNIDWTNSPNSEKEHFFYYIGGENGEVKSVTPQEFQKDVDASPQIPAPVSVAQTPQDSNLENWGLSRLPGGDIEQIYIKSDGDKIFNAARTATKSSLERWSFIVSPDLNDASNFRIFSPGTVKLNSSLVPFYAAIIPHLKDYQGSGDFKFIFNFAPEAVKDLTENITENTHGKYFRVRKFQYHPPNEVADVATIDSNELRHVQTGATLSMSFALLKFSGAATNSFYFGMQGNKSEVERLLSAITPALEAAEFVAEKPK